MCFRTVWKMFQHFVIVYKPLPRNEHRISFQRSPEWLYAIFIVMRAITFFQFRTIVRFSLNFVICFKGASYLIPSYSAEFAPNERHTLYIRYFATQCRDGVLPSGYVFFLCKWLTAWCDSVFRKPKLIKCCFTIKTN